ncbi:DUF6265 family protein [Flavobacterium sp.]|uniref:DUF6265 family protein n=1 Tax=Flavobacterium sp. TaxID=239 RepID=UPI0039E2E781
MKKNTLLLALAVGTFIISCDKKAEKQPAQITKADWLLGDWENKTPQGDLSESWQKANDSTYNGASYFIKGKDTLFAESVVLSEKNGEVLYTVTAKGQNNDLPVAFKMTTATAKQIIFENPAHDFPTKIQYQLVNKDSIVAQISGKQEGKPASETFAFGRKK